MLALANFWVEHCLALTRKVRSQVGINFRAGTIPVRAHKLTTGMASNSQPRYLPEGKKIASSATAAALRTGDIYTVPFTGGNESRGVDLEFCARGRARSCWKIEKTAALYAQSLGCV